MTLERRAGRLAAVVACIAAVAGCAGGVATSVPSPTSAASEASTPASPSPSASVAAEPSSSASTAAIEAVTLDAPASVKAGTEFEVAWTGPAGQGDYVTMVLMGVTQRTNEQTFDTTTPSPGKLVAPTKPGEYELWYIRGASDLAMARRPITVIP